MAGNLGSDGCPACDNFLYCIKVASIRRREGSKRRQKLQLEDRARRSSDECCVLLTTGIREPMKDLLSDTRRLASAGGSPLRRPVPKPRRRR
jgi:hypothetical protein